MRAHARLVVTRVIEELRANGWRIAPLVVVRHGRVAIGDAIAVALGADCAAILIGAEVFGAAFAGGWAVASYLDLGPYGVHVMQGIFFLCGLAVMATFIRNARRVEPFPTRG